MEKCRGSVLLRVLLSAGIVFFGLNSIFFYMDSPNNVINLILFLGLIIQFILGVIILFSKCDKKAYQFFIALIFIGWGILNCLVKFVLDSDVNRVWPIYLILISVFLFTSGIRKYKKLKFGYVIPSFTLLCMGIWFSLFSFYIVKIPFKTVVIILGPAFIVLVGLSLVLFFLLQQRHREFVVNDDDSGDFDDEELSFPKID